MHTKQLSLTGNLAKVESGQPLKDEVSGKAQLHQSGYFASRVFVRFLFCRQASANPQLRNSYCLPKEEKTILGIQRESEKRLSRIFSRAAEKS